MTEMENREEQNQRIEFFPNHWEERTWNYSGKDHEEIRAWGTLRDGPGENERPALIRIRDMHVSCELQIPHKMGPINMKWTEGEVRRLIHCYKDYISTWSKGAQKPRRDRANGLVHAHHHRARPFYYYKTTKAHFIRLFFDTRESMRKFLEPLQDEKRRYRKTIKLFWAGMPVSVRLYAWETHIETVKKMMAELKGKAKYVGWHQMKAKPVPDSERLSYDRYPEFLVSWKSLQLLPDPTPPSILIASFDIETNSEKGGFPVSSFPADVSHMISVVTERVGKPETRQNYLFTIGPCKVDNAINLDFPDEMSLLWGFAKFIRDVDPDLMTGWNTLQFDWPYLIGRTELFMEGDFLELWQVASREKPVPCRHPWKDVCRECSVAYVVEKTMNSSGRGENQYTGIKVRGRMTLVDLLIIMMADVNERTYALGYISEKYLGEGETKNDMTVADMFRIWQKYRDTPKDHPERAHWEEEYRRLGYYGVQDSALVNKLFAKRSIWAWLCTQAGMYSVNPEDTYIYGQQKRGKSMFFEGCRQAGVVMTTRDAPRCPKFSGGYVVDPIRGLHDGVFCLDYNAMYPNMARRYNIDHTTLLKPEEALKILEAIAARYQIAYNIDRMPDFEKGEGLPESLLKPLVEYVERTDDFLVSKDYYIIVWKDVTEEEERVKVGKATRIRRKEKVHYHGFVYRKPDEVRGNNYQGILPTIAARLIGERNQVKREMKKHDPTSDIYRQLDQKQLVIKMATNSLYGMLGARESPFSLFEGAMSITAWGRQNIQYTARVVCKHYEDEGAVVIYGDTDSFMIKLRNLKGMLPETTEENRRHNRRLLFQRTQEFEEVANSVNDHPLHLELEKYMWGLFFQKKMYAYYAIQEDGSFLQGKPKPIELDEDGNRIIRSYLTGKEDLFPNANSVLNSKGIPTARREDSKFKLTVYEDSLRLAMENADRETFWDMFMFHTLRLVRRQVPLSDFVSVQRISTTYKDAGNRLAVFSSYRSSINMPITGGAKMGLVSVDPKLGTPPFKLNAGPKLRGEDELVMARKNGIPMSLDIYTYMESLERSEEPYALIMGEDWKEQMQERMANNDLMVELAIQKSLAFLFQAEIRKILADGIPERDVYEFLKCPNKYRTKTKALRVIAVIKARLKRRYVWDMRENGHPVKLLKEGLKARYYLWKEIEEKVPRAPPFKSEIESILPTDPDDFEADLDLDPDDLTEAVNETEPLYTEERIRALETFWNKPKEYEEPEIKLENQERKAFRWICEREACACYGVCEKNCRISSWRPNTGIYDPGTFYLRPEHMKGTPPRPDVIKDLPFHPSYWPVYLDLVTIPN